MRKIWIFILSIITFCIILPAFLSAQVDTAWVRRYNGPGNGNDIVQALTVDNLDNIYVTGHSRGLSMSSDYATIKYYPNGDTAWVRRYNGPGNGDDGAYSIAVDDSNNVYVTGFCFDSSTGNDYTTIKYYPNGDTAWVRRYDGPGFASDIANDIAVDWTGNIYVTGQSAGSDSVSDFATIKYYSSGGTAWVRRYNGPGNGYDFPTDIAVDSNANVYVTGCSFDSNSYYDYATVKYYPNGDTAWVRRYNGPWFGYDEANDLTIGGSGNVYITGTSMGANGMVDYATIKYYPNGDTAWVRRYNDPGNGDDIAYSVAVDRLGSVYVTGSVDASGSFTDYATIKYYPNGDTGWIRGYNGPGDRNDEALVLAVDSSGNVYVTGESVGSGSSYDYATIKYYPNGDTAWVRRYNGPGNSIDEGYDIKVNDSGNVYVTGRSDNLTTFYDYTTIKYSPTGEVDESFSSRVHPNQLIEIHPNPARSFCTFRFSQPLGHSKIRLYDIAGKNVGEITNKEQASDLRISLNAIAPGVYFVRVDGVSVVGKIVITK